MHSAPSRQVCGACHCVARCQGLHLLGGSLCALLCLQMSAVFLLLRKSFWVHLQAASCCMAARLTTIEASSRWLRLLICTPPAPLPQLAFENFWLPVPCHIWWQAPWWQQLQVSAPMYIPSPPPLSCITSSVQPTPELVAPCALQASQLVARSQVAAAIVAVVMLLGLAYSLGHGAELISVPAITLALASLLGASAAIGLGRVQKEFGFMDWQHSER